ncbi:SWIM-type domain-containing protein, partial [Aphis craccivora]
MFDQLPSSFINIINNCVIRSNISSYDLCDKWITEFSEITNTSWVVRNTKKNCERFVYRKDYVCHHSSYQK